MDLTSAPSGLERVAPNAILIAGLAHITQYLIVKIVIHSQIHVSRVGNSNVFGTVIAIVFTKIRLKSAFIPYHVGVR